MRSSVVACVNGSRLGLMEDHLEDTIATEANTSTVK
jgi:hypothetical protein